MRRLFSGWRLVSQRCWQIGIRRTGSRCREQRSGRSILPRFVLVILPPTLCSLFLSRGFTESWLIGLGRKVCCLRQLDASADESEEIHVELPAYVDDFSCQSSATRPDRLPRVETAREHGLQLNMASNKTEAVVDFRGKGRQQVLEDSAVEFPDVDGQWTPTVKVADGVLLKLVSTCRHLGTQASHGARRGPELAARRSAARASHAQEDPESETSLQEGQGGGRPRGCQLPFALWGW